MATVLIQFLHSFTSYLQRRRSFFVGLEFAGFPSCLSTYCGFCSCLMVTYLVLYIARNFSVSLSLSLCLSVCLSACLSLSVSLSLVHGKAPQYLKDLMTTSERLYVHGNKQLLPRTRIDIFKMSFSFSGSLAWNSLRHHLRYPMELKTFKRKAFHALTKPP